MKDLLKIFINLGEPLDVLISNATYYKYEEKLFIVYRANDGNLNITSMVLSFRNKTGNGFESKSFGIELKKKLKFLKILINQI